jgi:hypothetical protein
MREQGGGMRGETLRALGWDGERCGSRVLLFFSFLYSYKYSSVLHSATELYKFDIIITNFEMVRIHQVAGWQAAVWLIQGMAKEDRTVVGGGGMGR